MLRPEMQADWLLEQSQQHFQKLASLAVRTEAVQRMGELMAHQEIQPLTDGISKVGHVSPSLTKVALNPLSMVKSLVGGVKSVVRGGARAGKVAVPKPPSVIMKGQLGAAKGVPKAPVAASTPSTARRVQPAAPAGVAPGRAVAPVAPAPAQGVPPAGQAGGAGQLAGAPAPLARPVSAPSPSRGPATSHLAKQTGDSQSIVSAKRMAEVTGRSPVDEYARMLEQAGYGTGMGSSTGASAARSLATGAATPGAKAGRSAVGRVSAPAPVASAATPGTQAVTPSMIQPAPVPPPIPSAGPYRAPGGLAGTPAAPPAPQQTLFSGAMEGLGGPAMPAQAAVPLRGSAAHVAAKGQKVPRRLRNVDTGGAVPSAPAAPIQPTAARPASAGTIVAPSPIRASGGVAARPPSTGTGRVRSKQSLDDRIAHSQRAGEMRDAINAEDMAALGVTPNMATSAGRTSGAGALAGEATQQAAGQAGELVKGTAQQTTGQVGGIRGMLGRVPGPLKYAPHAVIGGTGLAAGGLALGGGMAMQQSGAPYRYGGGAPLPGMYAQQM